MVSYTYFSVALEPAGSFVSQFDNFLEPRKNFNMQKSLKRFSKHWRQYDHDPNYVKILLPAIRGEVNAEQCRDFLDYVHEELGRMSKYPASYAINSPEKLLNVVEKFKPDLPRDQVIELMLGLDVNGAVNTPVSLQDPHCLSAELAIRIWINLHVQIPRRSPVPKITQVDTTILWRDNTTFQSLIHSEFEKRKGRPAMFSNKIDPKFSMALLVKEHGYQISWTSNLADHLKIDPGSPRRILIYEHKIFLWNHDRMAKKHVAVLPLPLVEEAIDTLNLLFPFGKKSTKSLLRRHGKAFHGLGNCGRATKYDIQEYHYWRKEIGELAEVLSQQPLGRAQFILNKDGTNTLQFWTFWTAIAFGMLAIFGVVTGVYSAVYAKKAFDVGMLQYQLALAQACSTLNATDLLPGFCH